MGLLTTLITLPLAPARSVVWVVEQVAEEADRQMFDEARIRGALLQLELDYDEGRVDDAERAAIEDELLERLATARQRKREETDLGVAMNDDGGPERGDA
jgi:hypothetical protein